ncbi:hypothetical protein D9V86_05090, partial [Bacteroidetes/Chlorobi group bacterium ChocPot_Mid]
YFISKLSHLGLYFFVIICASINLLSNNKIQINDTTINRGVISEIKITGSLSEANVNDLKIILEFNYLMIDIKEVIGSSDFIMKCPKIDTAYNIDNITKTSMTISCNDIQSIENGVFCILKVEGLASSDSLLLLKPMKLIVNGKESENIETRIGKIFIPGTPIFQTFPENIGNNFPNPFFEETIFPISIHEPTKVKFYIYTTDGRFILSNEKPNEMLKLSFYKDRTEIPISNLNEKLEKGFYRLKLLPDNMRFASGEYYLIMVTNLGVYFKNFIYFK